MNELDIMQLWNTCHAKLDDYLTMSRRQAQDILQIKTQSLLHSMRPVKLFTILTGIVWVGFVDILMIGTWSHASPFFLASAAIQSLLTTMAIGIYIYQWILIEGITLDEPVMSVQRRVARLTTSTLWVTRLLFLQLPVWTTFYLTQDMVENGSGIFWLIQVPVTLLFTVSAIWLFVHIRYENRQKRWFRWIFTGDEWTPLMKAMDMLGQLESIQEEKEK